MKNNSHKRTRTRAASESRLAFLTRLTLIALPLMFIWFAVITTGMNYFAPRDASAAQESSASVEEPALKLSKEYIYSGTRLIAAVDANAVESPPADLAVWRPSTGAWWVMSGQVMPQISFPWGMAGDVPVPGDFDGDGSTDFSIFRPSSSQWWIFRSSDSSYYALPFGTAGDRVAPADYDGDGRTDAAVFRPSNGFWYIFRSSTNSMEVRQFGMLGDIPSPADYDGDGRADVGVWRASNKVFYSMNSSDAAVRSILFDQSGSEAISADYDGDGRADHAIRNGSTWIIRKSSTDRFDSVDWQTNSDIAVPNDYDADAITDIAVWRPSSGTWYIRRSSDKQTLQVQWGMSGDIPVPAFYRR